MNTKSTSGQIRLDLDTGWPTKSGQLTPDRDDHWAQSPPGAQHFWRITFAIVMAPFALTGAPVFSAASHSLYPIDTTGKWLRHIFTNINLVPITILSLGDIANTLLFVGALPKNVLFTIGDLCNLLPIALPVTLFWFNAIHSISYSTYDWRLKHGITTESKLEFFGYIIATTLLFIVYLTFASAIHCKCIELNEFILNSANTAPDGSVELGRLREIKRKFKTNADNIVAINKTLNLVMSTFIITLIIEMFIDSINIMLLFSAYWGRPVTSTLGPVTGGAHTSVRHFRLLKYYMSARLERTETPAVLCISVFLGYNFLSQRFTARTNSRRWGGECLCGWANHRRGSAPIGLNIIGPTGRCGSDQEYGDLSSKKRLTGAANARNSTNVGPSMLMIITDATLTYICMSAGGMHHGQNIAMNALIKSTRPNTVQMRVAHNSSHTNHGTLKGVQKVEAGYSYRQFLGIPYASAPIG
ncbi:unnamed protein product, partial [Medioppia subpectinata]